MTHTTAAVPALAEALTVLRGTMGRGEVELNALQILLIVASYKGRTVPQATIRELTSLSESAVSRNLAILGEGHTSRVPGPKLIESHEDPEYRRRRLVKLTPRGKQLMETLQGIFDKHTSKG
jgi:DNA-binding MarR family transcriptional regulator